MQTSIFTPLQTLNNFSKNFVVKVKMLMVKKNIIQKQKGPLTILDCRFMDEYGTEMEGIAFADVADRINNIINVDGVYSISGAEVALNDNKDYTVVNNDYKLKFNRYTKVNEEDPNSIRNVSPRPNIFQLKELISMDTKKVVDVVGVVLKPVTLKIEKGYIEKTLVIGDHSGYQCNVKLYGDLAQFDVNEGNAIKINKLRINIYHSKILTSIPNTTTIDLIQDINEHIEIKKLDYFLKHNNYKEYKFQEFPKEGDVYTNAFPSNITNFI